MQLAIVKEVHPGERRVAATPETVKRLQKLGFEIVVQSGAGDGAAFSDEMFADAGAKIVPTAQAAWSSAKVVLKVRPPEKAASGDEVALVQKEQVLICFVWPAQNTELVERIAKRGATLIAMDQIPRVSRAQKMDALSSMANISGYRAVIEAAAEFGRFFTGQITAAGKVPPAKVLVIGAGVAGLSAIGTARGMGAIVRAFDTRLATREQVESMGAEFLELKFEEDGDGEGGYAKLMSKEFIDAEMALFRKQAKDVDIVITTALIPGRKAPTLWPKDVLEQMKAGSVVVDLAAEAGGNCELTQAEKIVRHNGVTVIGYIDLPSRMAPTASQLYGTNLIHLLTDMGGAADFKIDHEDEVVRGALVLEAGKMMWPAPKPSSPPPAPAEVKKAEPPKAVVKKSSGSSGLWVAFGAAFLVAGVGLFAPADFIQRFTVFVLACVVGYQVVWSVKPALHTPLMSVTNAISGIILVGGMLQVSGPVDAPITILAGIAVLVATINISGGFLVTQRMLKMFAK